MRVVSVIINAQAIRNTTVVNGYWATFPAKTKQIDIVVINLLNSVVTIQVQSGDLGQSAIANLGSTFDVAAAGGQAIRTLSRETSGISEKVRVTAVCAVAPTSDTVTVTAEADVEED